MKRLIDAENPHVLRPELGTRPRVCYKNLHRFTHCFNGGSVVARQGRGLECVKGALVTLRHNGAVVATCETDAFGDFKFDGLAPQSGRYRVDVTR
ncbi:carboxypeptidase family protein [Paraburkholderia sp. GV068]|uniref:hypothetical protein n=1 Tax=Paraburkholderia TaxID=1822464 RepID=UPI000D317F5C|nr:MULTISPECIES: hypothetical protein [unclassified Paraburkholderia]PTQ92990.1 carboxypeptidase family protein [Paraburkholderia sp. GV072]PUA99721.1 carboxypeptidase family protein [Paraburkholderia sp. GV068]